MIVEIGDKVYVEGVTSMAQYSGWEEVLDIDHKFDQDTGERFQIAKLAGNYWYNMTNGSCYSNKGFMYYVDIQKGKQ